MISITTPAASPAYAELNAQPMVLWDNILARATITNSALPTVNPRSRAVTESTADYWGATGTPDTLRGTVGVAEGADCCFIGAHTLAGKTIKVQRLVAAVWTDTATFTPTTNEPFMLVWPEQTSTGWGIEISGPGQVGVCFIGKRLVIPGGVQPGYSPVWAAREITRYPNVSMRGHYMGQKIEKAGASLGAAFMPLDYSFVLNSMAGFRTAYNNGKPFIWAAAPSVFTTDVAYAWADKGDVFSPTIMAGGQLCELSLRMRAYCER